MGLLTERKAYKPFDYPWAFEAWKLQQQTHWLPEEVPMADDIRDWKYKLTTAEKNLCTQIFRFFTQMDIEVHDCYSTKYSEIFQPIEVKMMLSSFQNMETIHVVAYAHLVETLGMPDEIYKEFLNYKEMRNKYNYLHKFKSDTKENIATTLAAYGAFTEGLQLFSSFVILLNFTRFNKMKGMGQIITWSIRDETLHLVHIIKLFHEFLDENPELKTKKLFDDIREICRTMVQLEDAFVDLAFEIDGAVEGLSSDEVKQYIRYIADRRLAQLGLEPEYNINENPIGSWLDPILNGVEHANFFETRATEYSKSATIGTWEDAFSIHDGGSREFKYEQEE